MPLTGEITPGNSFFCPHCGALYAVTVSRRPTTDSGSAKCVVCERVMTDLKSTSVRTYRLVHRPEDV
jgi:transcription elongation factor Elf1